ncbi:putative Mitochondrial dynamin GTPase [Taphrina deformans PYCC 5710]|uniref:dynamin GTPase n=1 Tax=Taphrina deformans (strain PYCC 5710 / ATCC 11124 / CBS 356.35 / IMI 108563 / JCM 9778 / NBRC 8474) TaxID=1097556 RepID=R4XCR1_TAPDE|nr:putative Mitochondrial dynamin GTPase [Taphrina deformans PYCC 5710]|eukprot:CCG81100.1 putative Mitochondrial dynamin GTPase [Taphrina deformans PYCC 5710]
MLVSQANVALISRSSTKRALSYATVPRILFSLVRIPAFIGATVTAGVVYVQYKVEEGTRYTKDLVGRSVEWLGDTWSSTKEAVERNTDFDVPAIRIPKWMQDALRIQETENGYERKPPTMAMKQSTPPSSSGGPSNDDGPKNGAATATTAAAAVYLYSDDQEEPSKKDKETQTTKKGGDEQMMVLTRKMIEIRNLLKQIDKTEALTLPSIVVIGSQSSGKSSVLESIVGHEFLPKGSNMVTRRPIELTLINTPHASAEYGMFPALGNAKITDFAQIQSTLTTMNKAVTDEECVSDDPIQLNIYSPNVPDLTLIDLPGYIQIQSKNQPADLKWKIAELCEKYIKEPNIILAVCAADVDLANSPALRASRKVDPLGIRTLGVVTKMDLVTPDRGAAILKDSNYPLSLGYVGVICKALPASSGGLFNKRENVFDLMSRNEKAFFGSSAVYAPEAGCMVGTQTLRKSLMRVLENSMASSLQSTSDAIRMELEEASYQYKVQYNDRNLTADTYVAETIDKFKHDFKQFSEQYGKQQVRSMLKEQLDQRVMDLLAERYWSAPEIMQWAEEPLEDVHWERKLEATQSALTRMGIGRLSTTAVTSRMIESMQELSLNGSLRSHPFAREIINNATRDIMNSRYHATSEQVENCIKPYKFEVDVEPNEWTAARQKATKLLEEEISMVQAEYKKLANAIGSRTLSRVMDYTSSGRETKESMGYSSALLDKGRAATFLKERETLLSLRLKFLKSKPCSNTSGKYVCPEIFLNAVAHKLTTTAVLFINVELLSEFFYQFPREIDNRLIHNLNREQVELFAKEDPKVKAHIDLQQKKELLELALNKMQSIMMLEKDRNGIAGAEIPSLRQGRRGYW